MNRPTLRTDRRDRYFKKLNPYSISSSALRAADNKYSSKNSIDEGLDPRKINEILRTYFTLIVKVCVSQAAFYKLPLNLGSIGIMTEQPKVKRIMDYNYYNQTGEYRFMKPDGGQGKIAKWYWLKESNKTRFRSPNQVRFTPTRAAKKELTKAIREENTIDLYLHSNKYYA